MPNSDPRIEKAYAAFATHPRAIATYRECADTPNETRQMIKCAQFLMAAAQLPHYLPETDTHPETRNELKPYEYASDFLNRISRERELSCGNEPNALWLAVISQAFSDCFDPLPPVEGTTTYNEAVTQQRQAVSWLESYSNADRKHICESAGVAEAFVIRKYREFKADPVARVELLKARA